MKYSSVIRKVGAVLLGALILFYAIYHVCVSVYVAVETETAVLSTLSDLYETEAYVIRNEKVITADTNGQVVDYAVEEGGKVSKGGTVANLYSSGDSITRQEQILRLETEISLLERLAGTKDSYAADPTVLNRQISDQLTELLAATTAGDFSKESEQRANLLFRLNQQALVTQDTFDYTARLTELKSQLESLRSNVSGSNGTITSESSGFFSKHVDGYENVFDYQKVEALTVEDLQKDVKPEEIPDNAVGKVAVNHEWYIACVINAETALKLSNLGSVEVSFPSLSSTPVDAEIVAINQNSYDSDAALILKCSTVEADLITARHETIEINLLSYNGILVRQDAIHFEDVEETIENEDGTTSTVVHKNVKGVYVLSADRLEFVQIFTVVSANGYAVCKIEPDENDELYTNNTIQLYDKVVVKGSDLYDGKIL